MFTNEPILSIKNLCVDFNLRKKFFKKQQIIHAVKDVSFDVFNNEIVGIIGESGSGKSTIGKTIVGLNSPTSGKVFFKNEKIIDENSNNLHKFRSDIQIIFQNYSSALDPQMTIAQILSEPFEIHRNTLSKHEIKQEIKEILDLMCIPQSYLKKHQHEVSGGQKQRISIARSLLVKPTILICDEIVSALDVIVQHDIVEMIKAVQQKTKLSIIFITHDIALANDLCTKILVMHNGKIVESGNTKTVLKNPTDAYTKKLVGSILRVNR